MDKSHTPKRSGPRAGPPPTQAAFQRAYANLQQAYSNVQKARMEARRASPKGEKSAGGGPASPREGGDLVSVERKAELLQRALQRGSLRFGDFKLKSGRRSPYFFDIGRLNSGSDLRLLGETLAEAIEVIGLAGDESGFAFDALFGAAYKGIALSALAAKTLAVGSDMELGWAHDRKEVKDHGEGGRLVGAELGDKKVLLIDDVLTAGTALKNSLALLRDAGARPVGLLVIFDRLERDAGGDAISKRLREEFKLPIYSICDCDDLLELLAERSGESPQWEKNWRRLRDYRQGKAI